MPVSHGLALVGLDRGFRELAATGWIDERPRLYAAQAAGCAPIADAWAEGAGTVTPVEHPDAICGPLEVPDPAGGNVVLDALGASDGGAAATSDDGILQAAVDLAGAGVPASATGGAAVSGARSLAADGAFEASETVVLLDPATVNREADILRSHLMKQGI
jgi:threonine synthase